MSMTGKRSTPVHGTTYMPGHQSPAVRVNAVRHRGRLAPRSTKTISTALHSTCPPTGQGTLCYTIDGRPTNTMTNWIATYWLAQDLSSSSATQYGEPTTVGRISQYWFSPPSNGRPMYPNESTPEALS